METKKEEKNKNKKTEIKVNKSQIRGAANDDDGARRSRGEE